MSVAMIPPAVLVMGISAVAGEEQHCASPTLQVDTYVTAGNGDFFKRQVEAYAGFFNLTSHDNGRYHGRSTSTRGLL